MFKFLKDKLKGAIERISKKVEEPEEKIEPEIDEPEDKPKEAEGIVEEKVGRIKEKKKGGGTEEAKEKKDKKGFFGRIRDKFETTTISEKRFDELFWELEVVLLENNVAFEVIEKLKNELGERLVGKAIKRKDIGIAVKEGLKESILELFAGGDIDLIQSIKKKKKEKEPFVILFFGVNGGGKTTTIAKFTHLLKNNGFSCVMAAADTFRAASIEQIEEHGKKLGVKVIKHQYGSDAAAVAFDAIKHAKAKGVDVVLVDTAGRMHSNIDLIEEMKKIVRVSKPDLKVFVGESITGNDCIEQARLFDKSVCIDGVILSKLDIDEKGGTAISISYVVGKPIIFFGTGQGYDDLKKFNKDEIVNGLGL